MVTRLFFKHKEPIEPLPYQYYFIPVAIIALIGVFDSIYLAFSHYRNYTDIGYQSFCAISQAWNCDTVAQSPYSVLFGVPLAVWGILGYGFFLFLLGFTLLSPGEKKRMWTLLMVIALCFSIYSVYLAYISAYKIHSHCIMCILSYAVSLTLLFYTWLIRNRFRCESFLSALKLDIFYLLKFSKTTIPIISVFSGAAIIMIFFFPAYWHMTPPPLSENISTGVTKTGHPWIGAENPDLTIVEFSDYRCFQCKKMHFYLRQFIEANPDKIRLVHRHFPLDHIVNPIIQEPLHQGAAKLAIISLFALEQDRFWEVNDFLFELPGGELTVNLQDLAEKKELEYIELAQALQDKRLWRKLRKDIFYALDYDLNGTPGFVIDGKMYTGQIPLEILKPYLK